MKTLTSTLALILFGAFNLIAQPFGTQTQWEEYFKSKRKSLDPIEGIWINSNTTTEIDEVYNTRNAKYNPQVGSVAICKIGNSFYSYDIPNNNSKSEVTFEGSATSGIYFCKVYYKRSYSTAKANAILTGDGLLEFSYELPTPEAKYRVRQSGQRWYDGLRATFEHQWIKVYPKESDYEEKQPSSGTGFAISSNGIIATNYHVIDGAKLIKVKGINSDFNKFYKALVLFSDKNNDLALIQIEDFSFTSLGTIPYIIETNQVEVGEDIFVLGYPLRATMGDEIKLTNGIISSKTGFQGDITSYQISAPVQPGNSGGPLFDSQGYLIGVINAKHTGAENVTYGVKSSYLNSLIEMLPSPPKLQTINSLTGKPLTQQVELVKKYVYIIEIE